VHTPVEYLKQLSPDRSVADALAEVFRKRIETGEYLPGMRLVEAEISKLFGVSRGPVREAFRRLIAEGLLDAEKHKSPVVKGIGREQFRQIFEVRAVLEGFAARLAAKNARSVTDRGRLEALLDVWSAGFSDPDQFVAANTEFHATLLALADHAVLAEQITKLAIPGYKAVFRPVVTADDMVASAQQHTGILRAVLAADEQLAERRTIDHVLDTSRRIGANFRPELFDRRVRELERLRSDAAG